jgi:hypothetical protein
MTILEAIHRIDVLKPNTYTQAEKIRWLSELDGMVKREIIDPHEGDEKVTYNGYDDNTVLTTPLIVPHPYDRIYLPWLQAQIDYFNGENGKYQNSMSMFNEAYRAFEKYYNRTNMPKGKKMKFF